MKPIKASDERTLENAIAMANAIASKSMHDLDKRHLEDFYPEQPPPPCQTPNSPTAKKFSFWFPNSGGGGGSAGAGAAAAAGERRHFSDEANANADIESLLTPGAKDAYKVPNAKRSTYKRLGSVQLVPTHPSVEGSHGKAYAVRRLREFSSVNSLKREEGGK